MVFWGSEISAHCVEHNYTIKNALHALTFSVMVLARFLIYSLKEGSPGEYLLKALISCISADMTMTYGISLHTIPLKLLYIQKVHFGICYVGIIISRFHYQKTNKNKQSLWLADCLSWQKWNKVHSYHNSSNRIATICLRHRGCNSLRVSDSL